MPGAAPPCAPPSNRPARPPRRPGPAPTRCRAAPTPAGRSRSSPAPGRRPAPPRPPPAGPAHSQVPHGLIRCASTARSACASVPTVTVSRAEPPGGHLDPGRVVEVEQPVGRPRIADAHHRHVFDRLTPGRRHVAGEVEPGPQRIQPRRGVGGHRHRHRDAQVVPGRQRAPAARPGVAAQPAGHCHVTAPAQRRVDAVAGHGQVAGSAARPGPRRPDADAAPGSPAGRPAAPARGCAASSGRTAAGRPRLPGPARRRAAGPAASMSSRAVTVAIS